MLQAAKRCLDASSVSTETEAAEHCLKLGRMCISIILSALRETERCAAVSLKQSVMEGGVASGSIVSEISITPIYYMKYKFNILFVL